MTFAATAARCAAALAAFTACCTTSIARADEPEPPADWTVSQYSLWPELRLFGDYTVWAFTAAAAVYQDIAGTGRV
ncbi:hypothetical protein QCE62_11635 [Caballeronia sp. LZ033]|uniref:hypothetical protein n=1 Tax=Caballeronia sp. LZ033 TaxID=3038566 RepID=UPI0028568AE9|nr:hypothetical protein [Caballeronia sp. LZ033]MDR5814233.1 hypothetical protein [Caballeronia sp. LZ033]